MWQYQYRANEEAYSMLVRIQIEKFWDYLPLKIQIKKLQIWECDILFKIGQ